jgi:hypothetical protein
METVGPMAVIASVMFVVSPFVVVMTLSFQLGGRNRLRIRWASSCCEDHWLAALFSRPGQGLAAVAEVSTGALTHAEATLATISNGTR